LSVTVFEVCVADAEDWEDGDAETEGCWAWSGKVASTMAMSKQHFQTICLIFSLWLRRREMMRIAASLGRYHLLVWSFPGTRDFDAQDYTCGVHFRLSYKFS
jgi:hypothetical protein